MKNQIQRIIASRLLMVGNIYGGGLVRYACMEGEFVYSPLFPPFHPSEVNAGDVQPLMTQPFGDL